MIYDFAICYFGMTRAVKKVYETHFQHVFNVLKEKNLTYKVFLHTWSTEGGEQRVWETIIPAKIDYSEYKLLQPDFYRLDSQDTFLAELDMDKYFYRDVWNQRGNSGDGEWLPKLLTNHVCALESQKRCMNMVEEYVKGGHSFRQVIMLRPDALLLNPLPIDSILENPDEITVRNCFHFEGTNDNFYAVSYENALYVAKRIDGLPEYRKEFGRIVAEKYLDHIRHQYGIQLNEVQFDMELIRP